MATQEQKIIFKAIETVLISYSKYKNKIKINFERLNDPKILNSYSLDKVSGKGYSEIKSECERIEDLKSRISKDIKMYEEMVFRIDSALEMVKDNEVIYKYVEKDNNPNNIKEEK